MIVIFERSKQNDYRHNSNDDKKISKKKQVDNSDNSKEKKITRKKSNVLISYRSFEKWKAKYINLFVYKKDNLGANKDR